ncbi:hypothetical protein PssvBMR4_gp66 [Pseudomonas phage MR4]|uniref:Uncharacterized protein n=1 Tax=Pseudomonas phage MR4 TaxID=2711171 RepID=A0A6M3TCN1_9CAUD|nr:hypothetical protein PssvBMR4_gp66 [Pseudomonas phage MR4]
MVHSEYFNGKNAYSNGKDITDNPHPASDTDRWMSWRLGWLKAEELDGA